MSEPSDAYTQPTASGHPNHLLSDDPSLDPEENRTRALARSYMEAWCCQECHTSRHDLRCAADGTQLFKSGPHPGHELIPIHPAGERVIRDFGFTTLSIASDRFDCPECT